MVGSGGGNSRAGNTDPFAVKHDKDPVAQRRAKAMLLKLSDFPDGWRAFAVSSSQDKAGQRNLRNCLGVDYSDLTVIGDASSREFVMGENTNADSETQIFASKAQASDALRRFSDGMAGSKIKDCFKRLLEKSVPSDYRVGEIDVGELSFTSPGGLDDAKAWQIVVPFEPISSAAGSKSSGYIDLAYLRKGGAIAQVNTSDEVTAFDSELRNHLVRAVARRLSGSQ